jgi:undecaprenyl-diphosphatase
MLGAEVLRRRAERRAAVEGKARVEQEESFGTAEKISFRAAALVGAIQALALLPGISRSGVTIGGGLLAGLRHQEAARFSFLLATPIIAAAGLIEVPLLFSPNVPLVEYLAGAVLALAAAYLSARFLLRYFRSGRLDPYGWYCAAAGLASLLLLTFYL